MRYYQVEMTMPTVPASITNNALAQNPIFHLIVGLLLFAFFVQILRQRILTTIPFVNTRVGSIRRVLNAVVMAVLQATVAYQFDHATGFRLSDTIDSSYHLGPFPLTFAAIFVIPLLLIRLSNPNPRQDEKYSRRVRQALMYAFAIFVGFGLAVLGSV
jgi:hypothetical protein